MVTKKTTKMRERKKRRIKRRSGTLAVDSCTLRIGVLLVMTLVCWIAVSCEDVSTVLVEPVISLSLRYPLVPLAIE